jgi:L-lactate dehydrogenase complex protein LldG
LSPRENILGRVRTALGRNGAAPASVPEARLRVPEVPAGERVEQFCRALGVLAAHTHVVQSRESAAKAVRDLAGDRTTVVTGSEFLRECGISFPSVKAEAAAVGITGAEYGLADTGTLVVLSATESRLASLLPPVHIAVIDSRRILSGLDELLTLVPEPANLTASMVLITGPSRTADIEQILVRGVHGPGELHVVVVL